MINTKLNKIDFINFETEESNNLKKRIEKALDIILKIHNIKTPFEVSFEIVDDDKIQNLNYCYRDINETTDVLSFPIFNSIEEIKKLNSLLIQNLGDVIINIDQVNRQARDYGNSTDQEILYLTIHSFLHLLGYDHMVDSDKKEMRQLEKKVLNLLEKDEY